MNVQSGIGICMVVSVEHYIKKFPEKNLLGPQIFVWPKILSHPKFLSDLNFQSCRCPTLMMYEAWSYNLRPSSILTSSSLLGCLHFWCPLHFYGQLCYKWMISLSRSLVKLGHWHCSTLRGSFVFFFTFRGQADWLSGQNNDQPTNLGKEAPSQSLKNIL